MGTPANISLKQLSGIVDQAVKAALQRNPARTTSGFVINPGILAGPILDAATDLKVAQKIANDITEHVQKGHFAAHSAPGAAPLQSGVLVTHNHIICGFFPYPAPVLTQEE